MSQVVDTKQRIKETEMILNEISELVSIGEKITGVHFFTAGDSSGESSFVLDATYQPDLVADVRTDILGFINTLIYQLENKLFELWKGGSEE